MKWTKTKRVGEPRAWVAHRDSPYAGNKGPNSQIGYPVGGGIQLECSHNYNGSGKTAFGGADKWPHLKLSVSFRQGDYKTRDEFAAKLQAFIDKELPL